MTGYPPYADADLVTRLIQVTEDLARAVHDLTKTVEVLTTQVAVRVITLDVEPPLPSIQQDER